MRTAIQSLFNLKLFNQIRRINMSRSSTPEVTQPSNWHTSPRFHLPGLNLPLNWVPNEAYTTYRRGGTVHVLADGYGQNLFPSALVDADVEDSRSSALRLMPLRELDMVHIMDAITDKPEWHRKVFDETIAQKWKDEIKAAPGKNMTENMADWIIDELRWKAKFLEQTGQVIAYEADVVKSDVAVVESTKLALQSEVRNLENIPDCYKDYHPGSDGKVLDIVHPSLFPLVYGLSRVLPDSEIGLDGCIESCGKGDIIGVRPDDEMLAKRTGLESVHSYRKTPVYSKNYQWLPSDVEFNESGKAKFKSYINNLHPEKHETLYSIIEDVVTAAIPLWNTTLSRFLDVNRYVDQVERIPYDGPGYSRTADDIPEDEHPQQRPGEDEDDFYERQSLWERSVRVIEQPDCGEWKVPPKMKKRLNLKEDFPGRELQIIVKLANIELTPKKPDYEGGSWHVEGQLNEHICATALYYYDSENITSSRLAFRQQADNRTCDDFSYEQDDHDFLWEIYGIRNKVAVQTLGSVACTEGRLLTFPNVLQHQVQPFKLEDPTKPGHRKILALFLVDPNIRIIGTANVPPQQRDWWKESVLRDSEGTGRALATLSPEMKEKVFDAVEDFPIGMNEAKEIRLKLMEERKHFVVDQGEAFEATEFSLCEH